MMMRMIRDVESLVPMTLRTTSAHTLYTNAFLKMLKASGVISLRAAWRRLFNDSCIVYACLQWFFIQHNKAMSASVNNDPLATLETVHEVEHAFHASAFVYDKARKNAETESLMIKKLSSGGYLDPKLLDDLNDTNNKDVFLLQLRPETTTKVPKFPAVETEKFSDAFKANLASIQQYTNFAFDIQEFIKAFVAQDKTETDKFLKTYTQILNGEAIPIANRVVSHVV